MCEKPHDKMWLKCSFALHVLFDLSSKNFIVFSSTAICVSHLFNYFALKLYCWDVFFCAVVQVSTQSGATATATVASTESQSSSSSDLSLAASADASLNINTSEKGKTVVFRTFCHYLSFCRYTEKWFSICIFSLIYSFHRKYLFCTWWHHTNRIRIWFQRSHCKVENI